MAPNEILISSDICCTCYVQRVSKSEMSRSACANVMRISSHGLLHRCDPHNQSDRPSAVLNRPPCRTYQMMAEQGL